MAFTVATYNVLATAYLGRGDYSAVPPDLLDPNWRVPALVRHVAGLGADVLCLQEVEAEVFDALQTQLGPRRFEGLCEFKVHNKPDGSATFFRTDRFCLERAERLEYHDDEKGKGHHSGFVAVLLALRQGDRLLGVANTHLRWDRPGTPLREQVGYRQAVELIDTCQRFTPTCDGWVICGDFNRRPNAEVVSAIRKAGFDHAHAGRPRVRSAVTNRRASLIDYLFHTGSLAANPFDPPPVEDRTVLPSEDQPSDHLALVAEFEWIGQGH